jgi:hypothetical protein
MVPLRRFNSTCLTRSGVDPTLAFCRDVRGGVTALVRVLGPGSDIDMDVSG